MERLVVSMKDREMNDFEGRLISYLENCYDEVYFEDGKIYVSDEDMDESYEIVVKTME